MAEAINVVEPTLMTEAGHCYSFISSFCSASKGSRILRLWISRQAELSFSGKNIHITKYKAEQYITLLERAFVLHRVFPMGTNVMKEPKVVMALPYRLLYRPLAEAIGGLREDFFVEAFRSFGKEVFYLKSMRGQKTPDYLIRDFEDIIFEVGGKGKGRSQFKGVDIKRKIILADGYDMTDIRRPLFLAGMLTG